MKLVMRRELAERDRKGRGASNTREEPSGSKRKVEDDGEIEMLLFEKSNQDFISDCSSMHVLRFVEEPVCKVKRRVRLPDKPNNYPLNLWSLLKKSLGKDLSDIPLPVNFCEPLSFLQRLAENFDYSEILDKAANIDDSDEQLAYVAAFSVSCYANSENRVTKPFNPLLGETYECDRRDDLGWRLMSEQVSLHPPVVAQHCEGKQWTCWQEFTMTSRFKVKKIQVTPLGTIHLKFHRCGTHYTWTNVPTNVHNIIVGKLWIDQAGEMDICNHKNGSTCHLSYIPYSYLSKEGQRQVRGYILDKDGNASWVICGNWDSKVEIGRVTSTEGTKDHPVYKTDPYTVAWERRPPLPGSENFYNFTLLTCQLNEPEDGVAPTDSRWRADVRLMEEGNWPEANVVKQQLEDKQRSERKFRESITEKLAPYEPYWFKKEIEPVTGMKMHMFTGEYWICKEKGDWSRCPDIF